MCAYVPRGKDEACLTASVSLSSRVGGEGKGGARWIEQEMRSEKERGGEKRGRKWIKVKITK